MGAPASSLASQELVAPSRYPSTKWNSARRQVLRAVFFSGMLKSSGPLI